MRFANLLVLFKVICVCMVPFVASGCAEQTEYRFVMPSDSLESDIQSAVNASDEWNACNIGVHTSVAVGTPIGDDIPMYRVDTIPGEPPGTKGVTLLVTTTFGGTNVPHYVQFMHYNDTQATIAHEMGHAIAFPGHLKLGLMMARDAWQFGFHHVTAYECERAADSRSGKDITGY